MTQTIPGGEQPSKPPNTSVGTPNGDPLLGPSRQSENDWVQKYERRPDLECPIVSGDEVDHSPVMKGTVNAFRWHGNSSDPSKNPSKGLDLCELITSKGARELALAELAGCKIDRKGLRPAVRLAYLSDPSAVTEAPVLFVESMQEFLAAPLVASAQNKLSGAEIISAVRAAGYDVFVVGGAVRDSLRNALGFADQPAEMDLDLSGTVPFRVLDTLLKRQFDELELRCRLNSNQTVLFVKIEADNTKSQTIAEYAPLKHSFRDNGYRFDHDMKIDVGWRDLTMNCLFFDPNTRLLFDPGQQALDDIQCCRLRPVASGSLSPSPGGEAIRLFRLLKFTVRPGFDRCDYSEAAAWLSAHLEDCLRYFRSLPPRDKDPFNQRDRVLLKFYKSWDALRVDRKLHGWRELKTACARLDTHLRVAGADIELWSAGVQEIAS